MKRNWPVSHGSKSQKHRLNKEATYKGAHTVWFTSWKTWEQIFGVRSQACGYLPGMKMMEQDGSEAFRELHCSEF